MSKWKSLVEEHASRLPSGVLRFVLIVPFSLYDSFVQNHWDVIKSNQVLQGGIYSSAMASGEHLASKWSTFGFFWNFAVWMPAILIPPPYSLLFGIVDATTAVMLSIATHQQTGYSPHHIDLCRGTGAHDWQLPPGTNESFFEASARLNATVTTPYKMCKSYVQEWQYGVTLSFFYSLISFLNITFCISSCIFHYRESRRGNKSFRAWLLEGAIVFPKIIFTWLVIIIWHIPAILFRCLPISIKSRTRYARRYTIKTGLRVERAGEMQMSRITNLKKAKKRRMMRYEGGDGKGKAPTELAEFLGIYDILMLVVRDLHYADIVNLSLASKSVREAVLPAKGYERRMTHFRMYTCQKRSREQCWVCTNQICSSCTHARTLDQTTLYHHLDLCTPYCSPCYFRTVQKALSTRLHPRVCFCAPPTITPNILQRLFNLPADYDASRPALNRVTRSICRACDQLLDSELLEKREARTKAELRDPARAGKTTCAGCEGELGNGPRWWVCRTCKKECTAFCHVPWGKKRKEEDGVGENAV